MDLTFTVGVLSTTAASVAAVAAIGSWRAGNRAAALTTIEQERRHAELTPTFTVTLDDPTMSRTKLIVALEGPSALDRLDEIRMTIRDDTPARREVRPGPGVSAEDIKAQIWGPLRFIHGTDGGSEDGRTVQPFSLPVGEHRPFAMQPTLPPRWVNAEQWNDDYDGTPLRLALECKREGFKPWVLRIEVPLETIPTATNSIW